MSRDIRAIEKVLECLNEAGVAIKSAQLLTEGSTDMWLRGMTDMALANVYQCMELLEMQKYATIDEQLED